jgi:hypothetical protein
VRRGTFGVLERLLAVVVLVASGSYLLIYLYRWEWNRALISGLVFVAAEVALATVVLAGRVSSNRQPSASFDLALARLREAGVGRRRPFRWLEPRDRLGVFVPVLLGAGAILTALAYLVERLAEATAHVTVDRQLARRLALLAPARRPAAPADVLTWSRRERRAGPLVGLAAGAVLVALVVQVLADATQSRPDPSARPAVTEIALAVQQRTEEPVLDTAAALWVACRPVLPSRNRPDATLLPSAAGVTLVLQPGIRPLATKRLAGCLADATLSSVRASVLHVTHRDQEDLP